MNNLLRTGFQPVTETEMMMVEGGSPNPASDRNTVHGPGADDAGQYPIMEYPKRPDHPNNGGGGRDTNNGNAGNC